MFAEITDHYTAKEMTELLLNKKVPLTKIATSQPVCVQDNYVFIVDISKLDINQKIYVLTIWALGHVMANVVCIAVLMMKGILNILVGLDHNTWMLQTRTVWLKGITDMLLPVTTKKL